MQLVVQSGAEPGRTYDLATAHKVVIGRQSGNDVVVPDEQVSRKHAEVEERDGTLIVTDLNSSNGTFVNGTRIGSPQVLRNGDTVQVGTTVLRVLEAQTGAPTLPTSTNYRQAAQEAGYANQNYGAAPAPGPADNYGQPSPGYNQPSANPGYGQGQAGGYQAQPQAGGAYGAPDNNYNQPGVYNQAAQGYAGQGQAYDPNQGYGQAPGYGGQPLQPGYGVPPGYNQPAAYTGPAPALPTKKGVPLALLAVGGIVIVLAVALLLIFVVFGGGGSGAVGDLPAPKNSTKVDVSLQDLAKASATAIPAGVDINKFKLGVYSTTEKPDAVVAFYKDEMKKKGWSENTASTGGGSITFNKGDQEASVFSGALNSQAEVDSLAQVLPALKGKFKVGDTFVLIGQGPKS